ncbi:MAG: NADH:flavin oxidoreductase [Anaerolineae bacterium]|jgi:2,4-dienoyl-CoA reductase-like NADH-dependent reductase (Old Yellow Enzyme family)
MSILFAPIKVGDLQLENRFVRSATHEGLATERGFVTDELIKRYRRLARGEIGLIIAGYQYVHPLGRCYKHQAGIYDDEQIPGLKQLTDAIHEEGGKVAFQIAHGGVYARKDLIGETPMGPSNQPRDPAYFFKPKKMTEAQIEKVLDAFAQAARRAVAAGVDALQIHAAHGYLISQFLSPFFNHRDDRWGGSDENRFRFLREVYLRVRREMPVGMPLLVKINGHDYTPKEGITPPLAARYASWLVDLGIDGVEVSCGTVLESPWSMIRGTVPVKEMLRAFAWWQRPLVRMILNQDVGKFELKDGYNLDLAREIRASLDGVPLAVVGGMRRVSHMEAVLESEQADLISMSRPFLREPYLIRRIREGKTDAATCESCNRCAAAQVNDMAVRCYCKSFPQ